MHGSSYKITHTEERAFYQLRSNVCYDKKIASVRAGSAPAERDSAY
jgi:hypothetical protein